MAPEIGSRGALLPGVAQALGESAASEQPEAVIGGVKVECIVWATEDPADLAGVPGKQTLERLVCAALRAVDPARADSVQRWLADEPKGSTGPKAFGLSFIAKWYAERGADNFYQAIWEDEDIRDQLVARLDSLGAYERLMTLAS